MNKNDAYWMCPECGQTGVSSILYVPLCHRCNYKVSEVKVSSLVYNMINSERFRLEINKPSEDEGV